jgi:hypothetical protein
MRHATGPPPYGGPPELDTRSAGVRAIPTHRRSPELQLDLSVLTQIDAICRTTLGVRIDLDVAAPSPDSSYTEVYGLKPWDSLCSAGMGLYFSDFSVIPSWVATAQAHRAHGVFVTRVHHNTGPVVLNRSGVGVPWFDLLVHNARLIFDIPPQAVHGAPGSGRVIAIVAQLGVNGTFRSKGRRAGTVAVPSAEFGRDVIQVPWHSGLKLPRCADMYHRASALNDHHGRRALPANDTRKADTRPRPAFVPSADLGIPSPPPPKWDVEQLRTLTEGFPHSVTRDLALTAASGLRDTFVGDRTKSVAPSLRFHSPEVAVLLRAAMIKNVTAGVAWGPSPVDPFPFSQPYPPGHAKKHKYVPASDPLSTEIRVTSDLSDHHPASVNDLCERPEMTSKHFSAGDMCDTLVGMGPGVQLSWGDVPKAFKMNLLNPVLYFLFVHSITTGEFGREFFVDLCDVFGHTSAEWSWQCELGLIRWVLLRAGFTLDRLKWFVDNFYLFHAPGISDDHALESHLRVIKNLKVIGIDIHEAGIGKRFKAHGWEWDLHSPMSMRCPEDKFSFFCRQLKAWLPLPGLSLKECKSASGYMQFLAKAFPIGAAFIAPFLQMAQHGERVRSGPKGSKDPALVMVAFKRFPAGAEALFFWHTFFSSWDRVCPLVQGFGPCAGPEVYGWLDGSPTDGMGGIFFCPSAPLPNRLLGFHRPFSLDEEALLVTNSKQTKASAVAEALTFRAWASLFAGRCYGMRVVLCTDSETASQAFAKAFSERRGLRVPLRDTRLLFAHSFCCLRVCAVPNFLPALVVADHLSHERILQAQCLALDLFGTTLVLVK